MLGAERSTDGDHSEEVTMRTLTLAAAMVALISARATAADRRPHHPAPQDSTTATVQNDLNQPVMVYLETGDREIRLGTVGPESDSTFTVPRWLILTDSRDV